jgi:hypothetical protein
MARDYISGDRITGADLVELAAQTPNAPVFLVDMGSGETTPILGFMIDTESDDAPNLYLYTEPA